MKETGKPEWREAIYIFLRASAWIIAPAVCALLAVKIVDAKFETKPFLFLVIIGFAFAISIGKIFLMAKAAMIDLDKVIKKEDNNDRGK